MKEKNAHKNYSAYENYLKNNSCNYELIKKRYNKASKSFYEEAKKAAGVVFNGNEQVDVIRNCSVTNIHPNVCYEDLLFSNISFDRITLKNVCFYNCIFYKCSFNELNVEKPPFEINSEGNSFSVFSFCRFTDSQFNSCRLNTLYFSFGELERVKFVDTFFTDVIFQANSFNRVTIERNSELNGTLVLSPCHMLDIRFISDGGNIKVDSRSLIAPFLYKKDFYVKDKKTWKIFRKDHYKDISDTYLGFEQLLSENHRSDQRSINYYERKKAETRSEKGPKCFIGHLAEVVVGYGEKPFRAILTLLILMTVYAALYMLTGFYIDDCHIVKYHLCIFPKGCSMVVFLHDFAESLYFSFFTIVTVGQGTPKPFGELTKILSTTELLLGAVLITLFTGTLFRKMTK